MRKLRLRKVKSLTQDGTEGWLTQKLKSFLYQCGLSLFPPPDVGMARPARLVKLSEGWKLIRKVCKVL